MTEPTLLDRMFEKRDEERVRLAASMVKVTEDEALLEENANATTRWYLHPFLADRCINSMIVYRYEIEPGEETGLQQVQGNVILYVISGAGRTETNGVAHEWEAGDVINLPPLKDGHKVRHINTSDETALLIGAEPNLTEAFGIDLGSGFEQIEARPGWEKP